MAICWPTHRLLLLINHAISSVIKLEVAFLEGICWCLGLMGCIHYRAQSYLTCIDKTRTQITHAVLLLWMLWRNLFASLFYLHRDLREKSFLWLREVGCKWAGSKNIPQCLRRTLNILMHLCVEMVKKRFCVFFQEQFLSLLLCLVPYRAYW